MTKTKDLLDLLLRKELERNLKEIKQKVDSLISSYLKKRVVKTMAKQNADLPKKPRARKASVLSHPPVGVPSAPPTAKVSISKKGLQVLNLLRENGDGLEAIALMNRLSITQKGLTRIKNSIVEFALADPSLETSTDIFTIEGEGETALWKAGKDLVSLLAK